MKKGKFATAVAARPSVMQKGTMPSVMPSTQATTVAKKSFPANAAVKKGAKNSSKVTGTSPSKPTKMTTKNTKAPKNTVQTVAKRAPINSLKKARVYPGKAPAKAGVRPAMAVQGKNSSKRK